MSDELTERVARAMEDAAVAWLYENPTLGPQNIPYGFLADAAIAPIWNEAMEEAAKVAEDQAIHLRDTFAPIRIAAAIRARKRP